MSKQVKSKKRPLAQKEEKDQSELDLLEEFEQGSKPKRQKKEAPAAAAAPAAQPSTDESGDDVGEADAAVEAVLNPSVDNSGKWKDVVDKKGDHKIKKVVVVMQDASLETVKTKKGFELLCADTHNGILKKLNKEPAEYRPDITHQCLLTLLDSPLNKAGHLQVYIHTKNNILIEVNPSIRIPRTYKRFAGLMVQLLHKLKIRATDGSAMLMRVIKNPVTQHFPAGALKIACSVEGELVDMKEFVPALPPNKPVVFVVGAIAHGHFKVDYAESSIAVSRYPLSASVCLGRIMNAFENMWGIL